MNSCRRTSLFLITNLVISLGSIGCSSMGGNYNPRTFAQIQHKRSYAPVKTDGFKVEDKNIVAEYVPDILDAGTTFIFVNKTDKVVKIIWDESSFIGPTGQAERIFHGGVKIADRDQSMPPSIIPPKSSLNDDLIPTSRVDWESGQYGGWRYRPLCGSVSLMMKEVEDSQCIGKEFGYFITYEVDGKKMNVTAKFKYLSKEPLAMERNSASVP